MARKPRKTSSLQIYHVILRGNNKQSLFYDESDRNLFKNRIRKYSEQLDIQIYSYCLMQNHVHILLGNAPKQLLSLFIQKLANSYVYYFNHKYECSGHLFQGRFKSEPIESEASLKNVLRYILNNPEKAGICKMVQYKWSSYLEMINPKVDGLIDRHFIFSIFDSIKSLKHFLRIPDKTEYMEYENKSYFCDDKARLIMQQIVAPININSIKTLPIKELRNAILILKNHPFSNSQINRITGLPLGIIRKA